ncbi:MAG: NERD domain-containing protein, partial [Bifidobacteriaceae bacterium]|nr:NERD domain-containing protein [Bifidobacteriaceae bacterium]
SPADLPPAPPPSYVEGVAGDSARREFERRKQRREDRVRSQHPRIGGFLLAVSDDPQSTKAWDVGANGEEALGQRLNQAAGPLLRVLHDRRVPGSRANIDHIAVAPSGIWVIDAKKYQGRPQLDVSGGLFTARKEKLLVGRRDCTGLVAGVLRQIEPVKSILSQAGLDAPIQAVLCFVEADWPLFGGAIQTQGVRVIWPGRLIKLLSAPGPLSEHEVDQLQRLLTAGLSGR